MKTILNKNIKFYQKPKKLVIFLVLLVFIFFGLNFTGYSKKVKDFFFLISSPAQKLLWQSGNNVSSFFSGVLEAKNLKQELIRLRYENQEILAQIVRFLQIEKENEVLRQALELGLEKEFSLEIARVTSKDISQDSILINKGENDGLLKGHPVITKEKVLLGRIGQTYDNFSEVVLISNKESSFDAKILSYSAENQDQKKNEDKADDFNDSKWLVSEIYGIIKGKGNLVLDFDLIPKEMEISEEDLVVTSALGGVFPEDLLVGKVKTVKKSDLEIFQRAEISPMFKIGELDYLFVITKF